jgi:hypothetical protein
VNRLWKIERGSVLFSVYSIFVFGKSFRLCLSLISCSIDAASRLGLRRSWFRDACRHVDVFSQALILRASRILDPKFDSVVVSRGLLMILAVRVRCCLVGLFPWVKFSSWLCAGFCIFFSNSSLCALCSYLIKGFSGFQSMCTFPVSGTFVQ